jgi:ABC-type transport system involved in multi-copper enzyme maturation permease subunit
VGTVYSLALRQLAGRWRLATLAALAALPVLVAAVMLHSSEAARVTEFETVVLSAMLAGAITPLAVLALAGPAFGHEVEDRTLANLVLTPLPRWQIVAGKLLAAISVAAPFVAASAFATSWVAFLGDPRAVLAVTASSLLAVVLYATAFTWLGLVTTQAIGAGLLYIVLWEGLFSGFVTGVRRLSIRHHALALMHGLDARRFAEGDHPGAVGVVVAAVAVSAGFTWLAVRRLRRMDVP